MLVGISPEVVAGFIGVRTWGSRIRLLSLGSFVGVQWGTHLGSSRSSGVAGVRPWNHPGALNLLGFALGLVGVIRNRCVHSSALGVVGFIQGHWGAQWESSGSSCVAGYIGVCIEARPPLLGSFGGRRIAPWWS